MIIDASKVGRSVSVCYKRIDLWYKECIKTHIHFGFKKDVQAPPTP
jgi:hypothetical protein